MKPEFTEEHYAIIKEAIYNDWLTKNQDTGWIATQEFIIDSVSFNIIKNIKRLSINSKLELLEERLDKVGYEADPILSIVKELYGDK